MMALLTVDKLSKTYQATSKKAVKDISFAVDHGDIVAFLGPNGAGKTTTLKMILNLVSPDHGKVYFEGKETTNDNLLLLKNTGVLLEGSRNMFWSLSPIRSEERRVGKECRAWWWTDHLQRNRLILRDRVTD